jgi:nucleotide-binding universal stress UspA family protein
MFKHLLVPLALTKDRRAVAVAERLAGGKDGGRITLLHVIQRVERIPQREVADFYRRLQQLAKKTLGDAARRLAARGVNVRSVVVIGSPAREIARYADAKGVDLIVMNSHTIVDPLRPGEGLGTTSYRVAMLCRCPILLVK